MFEGKRSKTNPSTAYRIEELGGIICVIHVISAPPEPSCGAACGPSSLHEPRPLRRHHNCNGRGGRHRRISISRRLVDLPVQSCPPQGGARDPAHNRVTAEASPGTHRVSLLGATIPWVVTLLAPYHSRTFSSLRRDVPGASLSRFLISLGCRPAVFFVSPSHRPEDFVLDIDLAINRPYRALLECVSAKNSLAINVNLNNYSFLFTTAVTFPPQKKNGFLELDQGRVHRHGSLSARGLPMAYGSGALDSRHAEPPIITVIPPFWTSLLLRVYAWICL